MLARTQFTLTRLERSEAHANATAVMLRQQRDAHTRESDERTRQLEAELAATRANLTRAEGLAASASERLQGMEAAFKEKAAQHARAEAHASRLSESEAAHERSLAELHARIASEAQAQGEQQWRLQSSLDKARAAETELVDQAAGAAAQAAESRAEAAQLQAALGTSQEQLQAERAHRLQAEADLEGTRRELQVLEVEATELRAALARSTTALRDFTSRVSSSGASAAHLLPGSQHGSTCAPSPFTPARSHRPHPFTEAGPSASLPHSRPPLVSPATGLAYGAGLSPGASPAPGSGRTPLGQQHATRAHTPNSQTGARHRWGTEERGGHPLTPRPEAVWCPGSQPRASSGPYMPGHTPLQASPLHAPNASPRPLPPQNWSLRPPKPNGHEAAHSEQCVRPDLQHAGLTAAQHALDTALDELRSTVASVHSTPPPEDA